MRNNNGLIGSMPVMALFCGFNLEFQPRAVEAHIKLHFVLRWRRGGVAEAHFA